MAESTSNKLQTPKSVHAWLLLEDESFAMLSKHSKEGRFHVHTLYLDIHLHNSLHVKEHILFSSIKSSIQKVCSVSLVRENLRASPSSFWTWLSTKTCYEITQNSSFSVTYTEYTNYNLIARHVVDRPYNRRNVNSQRQGNLPSSTTGVCQSWHLHRK